MGAVFFAGTGHELGYCPDDTDNDPDDQFTCAILLGHYVHRKIHHILRESYPPAGLRSRRRINFMPIYCLGCCFSSPPSEMDSRMAVSAMMFCMR